MTTNDELKSFEHCYFKTINQHIIKFPIVFKPINESLSFKILGGSII